MPISAGTHNFFNQEPIKLLLENNFFSEAFELWKICHSINSSDFGEFGYVLEKAGLDYFPSFKNVVPIRFFYCSDLEEIVLPENVTIIDERAFQNCKNLKSIILPSTLRKIGCGAFMKCISLAHLVLPDSVTIIDGAAFSDCESLVSVVIPISVEKIEDNVFENCVSLEALTYLGTKKEWRSIEKHYRWKDKSNISVVHCSNGDITITQRK